MDILPQTAADLKAAAAELNRLRSETQCWLEQNAPAVPETVRLAVRGEVERLRRLAASTALAAGMAETGDADIPEFDWP